MSTTLPFLEESSLVTSATLVDSKTVTVTAVSNYGWQAFVKLRQYE